MKPRSKLIKRLTLNADIGERGVESREDQQMMPLLDMANIACGGHAGSSESVDYFTGLAQRYGVVVSAHLSYPDRENFGRVPLNISRLDLLKSLDQQRLLMPDVTVLKFHGALYNEACVDLELAESLTHWLIEAGFTQVLTLPGSALATAIEKVGRRGVVTVVREAFIERRYLFDEESEECKESQKSKRLRLMPRKYPMASIDQLDQALRQAQQLITERSITAYSDPSLEKSYCCPVDVDTLCIHSDSPIAVALTEACYSALQATR